MAFVIKNITGATPSDIHAALSAVIRNSRFTARVDYKVNKVSIHDVRLKESKHYCGNHPFACPVRPWGNPPHKRAKYLEGADWVGWNDLVNDVLDKLSVSADVASSVVIIRKGPKRRTVYDGHPHPMALYAYEWDKDAGAYSYEDRRGKKSEPSHYPEGTPGIAEYKA